MVIGVTMNKSIHNIDIPPTSSVQYNPLTLIQLLYVMPGRQTTYLSIMSVPLADYEYIKYSCIHNIVYTIVV